MVVAFCKWFNRGSPGARNGTSDQWFDDKSIEWAVETHNYGFTTTLRFPVPRVGTNCIRWKVCAYPQRNRETQPRNRARFNWHSLEENWLHPRFMQQRSLQNSKHSTSLEDVWKSIIITLVVWPSTGPWRHRWKLELAGKTSYQWSSVCNAATSARVLLLSIAKAIL